MPFFRATIAHSFIYFLIIFLPFIKAIHAASEHIASSKPFFGTFFREFNLVPGFYVYGSDLKKGAIPGITLGLISDEQFSLRTEIMNV